MNDEIKTMITQGAQAAAASSQTTTIHAMGHLLLEAGAKLEAAHAQIRRLQERTRAAESDLEQLRGETNEEEPAFSTSIGGGPFRDTVAEAMRAAFEEQAVEDTETQRADDAIEAKATALGGKYTLG